VCVDVAIEVLEDCSVLLLQISLQLTLMDATIVTGSLAIFWPAPFALLMQSCHSADPLLVYLTALNLMNHPLSCITIESPFLPNLQRQSESTVPHWPRPR
jgi:hypothetical protein